MEVFVHHNNYYTLFFFFCHTILWNIILLWHSPFFVTKILLKPWHYTQRQWLCEGLVTLWYISTVKPALMGHFSRIKLKHLPWYVIPWTPFSGMLITSIMVKTCHCLWSITVYKSQSNTMELARYTWWRPICHNDWWSAYRDGIIE